MNRRWLARAAVLALHLAVLALLLHMRAPAPRTPEARMLQLRLIATPPSARLPAAVTRPAAPPRTTTVAPGPEAKSTAPGPAAPSAGLVPVAPEPAAPATDPARTTLRLSLPPGYAASSAFARNPALSDPRSNTPRFTLEDRIAEATGGAGAWVEESTSDNRAQVVGALGADRTVFRRGDTCVEVFRSRIAQIDPFNESVKPTLRSVGKPYKCR